MGNQIVGITIEEIFEWQDKLESNVSEIIEELQNISKEKFYLWNL